MIQTSEQIDAISAALVKAQADMENVAKDRENPHFRAKYATLAGVLDEARPKFAKHGISVLQMPINGEGSNIGVVTRLLHSSGQFIESVLFVAPTKFDAQGAGSAITYLRRYALMAAAGIAPEDDDGNAAVASPQPQRAGMVRAADVPPNGAKNGNGAVLPVSPEEPPEMRLKRAAIRIGKAINSAPNDHVCDVVMDDARDDLAAIEKVTQPIFEFKDGLVDGVNAAKRLRARHNQRIAELRAGQ